MLKMYLRLVGCIAAICVLFGCLLPALFSARSTTTVLLGIVILLALPMVAWHWRETIIADVEAWEKIFTKKENN